MKWTLYTHKCYVCGDEVERTRKTGTFRCYNCKRKRQQTSYTYKSASSTDFNNFKSRLQ